MITLGRWPSLELEKEKNNTMKKETLGTKVANKMRALSHLDDTAARKEFNDFIDNILPGKEANLILKAMFKANRTSSKTPKHWSKTQKLFGAINSLAASPGYGDQFLPGGAISKVNRKVMNINSNFKSLNKTLEEILLDLEEKNDGN